MKKVFAVVVLPMLFAIASFAGDDNALTAGGDNAVAWSRIVGVITAPGVSNPVAGIASGAFPWTTTSGSAIVDSSSGVAFSVEGLVLVGGNASGTNGPVKMVKGTVVCNPGTSTQAVRDTPAVPLDVTGNAQFNGSLVRPLPPSCGNALFLIRVVPGNVWIATGAVRVITSP
jgi:hypothetical protein